MLGGGELIEIVTDMFAEMRAAPGVGLAAPQIGIDLQVRACAKKIPTCGPSASLAHALICCHGLSSRSVASDADEASN